jgi:hypothetical protein
MLSTNIINANLGMEGNVFSINIFNISFGRKKETKKIVDPPDSEKTEPPRSYKDYKTTLGSGSFDRIDDFSEEVYAYFFIEKNKQHDAWNLVNPVIVEKESGKKIEFGLSGFALEGCGGGLNNMKSLINRLKKLERKGVKVSFIPKVVDNEKLNAFQYIDSGVVIDDLIQSIDLINYRKNEFEWIFQTYDEIVNEPL